MQRDIVFQALKNAQLLNQTVLRDPIEEQPDFKAIFDSVCLQASQKATELNNQWIEESEGRLPDSSLKSLNQRGLCRRKWAIMKRILREDYGIDWMTPVEMNPFSVVVFD